MKRRDFLWLAGGGALALGISPAQAAIVPGPRRDRAAVPDRGATPATADGKRLVVVMLRGAVDGLNVVVPYAEKAYYDARPTIAIARPGTSNGALELDARFGLHPALASLMPLWRQGQLAFVHAAGSPDPTRSHFDAQFYIESGTPGVHTTPDGWMNRLLAALPGPHGPTAAIAVGPILPRILSGRMQAANLPLGPAATRPLPVAMPAVKAAFDRLYGGAGAPRRRASFPARPHAWPSSCAATGASASPSRRSAAGIRMSIRADTRASSRITCARSARALPPSPAASAPSGRIPPSSSSPSSAAPCARTTHTAPTTATAT